MGKFNNKISAEFHPPKKWILERALSYKNEDIDIGHLKEVGVKCPSSRVLMAMLDADPSVPKWKIYSAYYAVVLFGRWSIIPREGD